MTPSDAAKEGEPVRRWTTTLYLNRHGSEVSHYEPGIEAVKVIKLADHEAALLAAEEWGNSSEHPNWEAGWNAGYGRGRTDALLAARQVDEAAWDRDAARAAGRLLAEAGDALVARLWKAVAGTPTSVSLPDVQAAWYEAKERVELLPHTRPSDLDEDPALRAALLAAPRSPVGPLNRSAAVLEVLDYLPHPENPGTVREAEAIVDRVLAALNDPSEVGKSADIQSEPASDLEGEENAEPLAMGSGSLEEAARFAVAVLDAQVFSQGREWDPKLAYTASKYLSRNLPDGTIATQAETIHSLAIRFTEQEAELARAREAIRTALSTTWTPDDEGGWGTEEDQLYPDALLALAALIPHWQRWGDEAWGLAGRAEAELHRLREAVRTVAITGCREEMPSGDKCWAPAEFVIWGKLSTPGALGPRCYDHAAKHVGDRALGDPSWAIVDLRPLRAALESPVPASPESEAER